MDRGFDTTDLQRPSSVEVEARDGATVLTLYGELDHWMATFVRRRFGDLEGDVDVDCSGLTFMDCAGVNLLSEMNQRCRARRAKLTVVNPPRCVTRLLGLTGVDGVLDIRCWVSGR